ncbi:MAG: HEAT repeat domain-containing protein [Acidobacteria bacterium]|nr:HEAT repeat domain-containing protein [Acidobacteriota bacterium]
MMKVYRSAVSSLLGGVLTAGVAVVTAAAQNATEQTASKLTNPDRRIRLEGLRELRDSNPPDAAIRMAALLTDPIDAIQIEAIATEVNLFLAEKPAARRYRAGIVEVRNRSGLEAAFDAGPSATGGQAIPPELVKGLTAAMGDSSGRVRLDATYAFGTLVPGVLVRADVADLKPGIDVLRAALKDSESQIRRAAARVLGRLFGAFGGGCTGRCGELGGADVGDALIDAMNDRSAGVRAAAMAALGETRNERAIQALEERFTFHRRGDEAEAALDALARIGNPASLPLFKSLLKHGDLNVQRMAMEGVARIGARELGLEIEDLPKMSRSDVTMIASAFALHRLGRGRHVDRLVNAALTPSTAALARGYLVELGPSIATDLYPYLIESDSRVRLLAIDLLGELGNRSAIERLKPLSADPDAQIAAAARRAIARLEAGGPPS